MTATVVERLPEYAVVSPVEGDLCSDEKVRVVYDEECRMSKSDIETGDLVIITFWGGVNYVGRIDDAELPYINAMSWTKIECPQKRQQRAGANAPALCCLFHLSRTFAAGIMQQLQALSLIHIWIPGTAAAVNRSRPKRWSKSFAVSSLTLTGRAAA